MNKRMFPLAAIAGLLAATGPAAAASGCDCGMIQMMHDVTRGHVTSTVDLLEIKLSQVIREATASINAHITAAAESNSRLLNEKNAADSQRERDLEKMKAQTAASYAYDACRAATTAKSTATLLYGANSEARKIGQTQFDQAIYNPVKKPTDLVKQNFDEFCGMAGNLGVCTLVSSQDRDLDLQAQNLFEPKTYKDKEQRAAQAFIANIAAEKPFAIPRNAEALKSERGKAQLKQFFEYMARLSAGTSPAARQLGRNSPLKDTGDIAKYANQWLASTPSPPTEISLNEVVQRDVMRRYGNEKWYTEELPKISDPVQLAKLQTEIMAQQSYLLWEMNNNMVATSINIGHLLQLANEDRRPIWQAGAN